MTLLRGHADDKPLDSWLREDIWPVEAELTAEDIRIGAELGVLEMIKSGTTAFSDMYFEVEEIADVVDQAGVRALLGFTAITVGKDDEGHAPTWKRASRSLGNSTGGRTAGSTRRSSPTR